MAGEINLKIKADASQAKREVAGLEQIANKRDRGVAGVGRGMGKSGADGVGQVSKNLERLTKNADSAVRKVKELDAALKRVNERKGQLMGFVEAGAASDVHMKELEDLRRYERRQHRSLGHWRQVAADRQSAADQARNDQPGRQGFLARAKSLFGGMDGSRMTASLMEGNLGDLAGLMAGGVVGKVAGTVAGLAAAQFTRMAYNAAASEQKAMADLVPRLGLGGKGFTGDPAAYMGHLRDIARPLGFSGLEALQIQGAMSTGGSKGLGLNRDTQTAMQFSRVFGIDGGQAATMLASGERMGAFQAGDAKRFAEMLAREIAITGLGPRSQEVQEATLSLLNQQVQATGQSTPAAIMALQAVLNKTGIPGLQGSYGAATLSTMNNAVQHPSSDADEAVDMAVYRKLGITNPYQMLRAREQGIAYHGYMGAFMGLVEHQGTRDEQDYFISRHLHIPMSTVALMRQRAPHHRLSELFSGARLDRFEKSIAQGGTLQAALDKTLGLPGNQLRRGEATANDALARAGTPAVKGIGTVADRAEKSYTALLNIANNTAGIGYTTDRLYEFITGAKPGSVHGAEKAQQAFKNTPYMKRLQEDAAEEKATGALPLEGYLWDPRRHRFVPKPPHAPPTLPPVPGSGAPAQPSYVHNGTVHVKHHHVIEEKGVVSEESKAALQRAIRDVVQNEHHRHVMTSPKSNYRGNR